jgi:hypothetical protein
LLESTYDPVPPFSPSAPRLKSKSTTLTHIGLTNFSLLSHLKLLST